MCGPYWSQWSKRDLDDWQGKEEEDGLDDDVDGSDEKVDGREDCQCMKCMHCLMVNW